MYGSRPTSSAATGSGRAASSAASSGGVAVLGAAARSSRPSRPRRRCAAAEDLRRELRHPPRDVVEIDERRELPAELEQGRRALGLAPRRLVEARVLDRDGRMAGEHLEQPHVVLVELVQPELRDDDDADDPGPVAKRHREQRLLDRVGALDQLPELAVRSVADDERLAELGAATGDTLARPGSGAGRGDSDSTFGRARRGRRPGRARRRRRRRRDSCSSRRATEAPPRSRRRSRARR